MEYVDSKVPVYGFWVPNRPTYNSPTGKKAYQRALADSGRKVVGIPITTNDIELEILYVTDDPAASLDVDNVGKPTLDALKGIVYLDDRQVRAIRIVKFDKSQAIQISGRIGPLKAIWQGSHPHAVWVWVYCSSRKNELGIRCPEGWNIHALLAPWDPKSKSHQTVERKKRRSSKKASNGKGIKAT